MEGPAGQTGVEWGESKGMTMMGAAEKDGDNKVVCRRWTGLFTAVALYEGGLSKGQQAIEGHWKVWPRAAEGNRRKPALCLAMRANGP